jgi:hypothetical protein
LHDVHDLFEDEERYVDEEEDFHSSELRTSNYEWSQWTPSEMKKI